MADKNGFKRPMQLSVEVGAFFSGDGEGGVNVSVWNDQCVLRFWSKDSTKDKNNNSLFLKKETAIVFANILTNIGAQRMAAYQEGRPFDIVPPMPLKLMFFQQGKVAEAGQLVVETVPFGEEKNNFIKLTGYKNGTTWSVIFHDTILRQMTSEIENIQFEYHPDDTVFARFNKAIVDISKDSLIYNSVNKLNQNLMSGKGGGNGGSYNNGPTVIEGPTQSRDDGHIEF